MATTPRSSISERIRTLASRTDSNNTNTENKEHETVVSNNTSNVNSTSTDVEPESQSKQTSETIDDAMYLAKFEKQYDIKIEGCLKLLKSDTRISGEQKNGSKKHNGIRKGTRNLPPAFLKPRMFNILLEKMHDDLNKQQIATYELLIPYRLAGEMFAYHLGVRGREKPSQNEEVPVDAKINTAARVFFTSLNGHAGNFEKNNTVQKCTKAWLKALEKKVKERQTQRQNQEKEQHPQVFKLKLNAVYGEPTGRKRRTSGALRVGKKIKKKLSPRGPSTPNDGINGSTLIGLGTSLQKSLTKSLKKAAPNGKNSNGHRHTKQPFMGKETVTPIPTDGRKTGTKPVVPLLQLDSLPEKELVLVCLQCDLFRCALLSKDLRYDCCLCSD